MHLHVSIDGLSAHRALIGPLSNPILNTRRMVKVIALAIQFSDYIISLKTGHAYDAFILIADGPKKIL